MLKTLAEGNYSSLLTETPPNSTNRPKFYVGSHKPAQKGKVTTGNTPEFKGASLMSKATEICFISTKKESGDRNNWESWYAAYPYFFERELVDLDETDRNSDSYIVLTVHKFDLRNVVDCAHIPFSATPEPNLGDMQNDAIFGVHCKFNPGETGYLNGFPKKCKMMRVQENVFFVFGGRVADEVVNELTVIGIYRSEEMNTQNACKPKVEGVLPSPRSGFGWCQFGSSVYLFGGANQEGLLNDVWKIELQNITYTFHNTRADVKSTQILTCSSVVARKSPRLVACGSSLYLFGGKGESGFNQPVSVLNLHTLMWSDVEHAGSQLFQTNESIKVIGVKGPLILFGMQTYTGKWPHKYNCEVRVFDTDLQRSSSIATSYTANTEPAIVPIPGDLMFFKDAAMMKLIPGSYYQCHSIPQNYQSLSRLLGAIFDNELFTDTTVRFKAGKEVKFLRCCIAVRGSEGAGVLKFTNNSENEHTFLSYATFHCAVRYLYTDSITVPELPTDSFKGIALQTNVDFFEELLECATFFQMTNLVNLCVVALTQACSIEFSKVNFYADYRRLCWITSEPDFKRFGSLDTDYSELLQPDYLIICSDGEVEMHKLVLFAQSSLFRTVFTGGFERDKEEFHIDFPTKAVQLAKEFMYTDSLRVSPDMIVEMLQVSAYLGIQSLFLACQRQAAHDVNYSNFMATYSLARQLNANHLIRYCEDLYVKCHLGGIRQYQDFLEENPELKEGIAKLEIPKALSKKRYEKLTPEEKEAALKQFQEAHPDPAVPNISAFQAPEYYDPLPDFISEVQFIRMRSGQINLYKPPENLLRLSKHVSLEDEQWERGNRFVLSESDSSESDS